MRCINKFTAVLLAITMLSTVSGCGRETVGFAYDPEYEASGFRIVSESACPVAGSFAMQLCVVNEDVNLTDPSVDMSEAAAAGLFDLNRKEVLYAKNIHERLQPASLTKLMTAAVALKYGNPDDLITVTADVNINESGAVLCGLREGDKLTLNQALHALLMKSANDVAVAIAVHIGGSVEGFADLMNKEAIAIGATNSHFVNPHGLTAENHYVTAYDMYLIFNEALRYELVNEIIHMANYEMVYTDRNGSEKKVSIQTSNQYLAGNYKAPEQVSVIGGKTGTTAAARNCLILLVRDTSSNPYIAIILSAKERAILYEEMTALLNKITATPSAA